MKNFRVQIRYKGYYADFNVKAEDNADSIEKSILNESGRYTLNMVKIDDKIKEIITEIKLEEAKVAHRINKIEDSRAEVSIAT